MSEELKSVPAALVSYRRYVDAVSAPQPLDASAELARHAVTHQAAGILMIEQRCGAAEALSLLSTAAGRADKRVDEVAAGIVAKVQRRGTPGPGGRY